MAKAKGKGEPAKEGKKPVGRETWREEIREFYGKVLMMQEEEKRKISRDLHDETGQIVIALGAALNLVEKALKAGEIEEALTVINENRKLIQDIASRMKTMAFSLRPPALDLLGLSAALREYFAQCTKSSPLKIEFNENLKDAKLSEEIEITLYRIVQEAIFNVLKHAQANLVKVDLIFNDKNLQLVIKDNGQGFDLEEYRGHYDATKMGLRSIKERINILSGTFLLESNPGLGTKLTVGLPLDYGIWPESYLKRDLTDD